VAEAARAGAARLAAAAAPAAGVELLGPAPAPLARLRGRHRVQILLKGAEQAELREALRRARDAAVSLPERVQASFDLRPLSLL
jgi:primosomal protein N' (replication factor Y)